MAILDKLKFWKKQDDFAALDKELGAMNAAGPGPQTDHLGLPKRDFNASSGMDFAQPQEQDYSFGMSPPGNERPQNQPQVAPQQPQVAQQQVGSTTQLDLIAAKLETIKVSLESVNHRLLAVERALHVKDYKDTEEPRRRRGVW